MSPIRRMFDGVAHRYDFLNHTLSLFQDISWRKKSCRMLTGLVPEKARLLDLCGGTGDFAITYAKIIGKPSLSVIGDFSLGMLSLVPAKTTEAFPVQMNALGLPFPKEMFDVVLNGFGMRNVANTRKGLQETYRVLKPGGCFVTLEFFAPDGLFNRFFYKGLAPLFIPAVGAFFSGKKDAYEYLVRSIQRFLKVKEYATLAEECGFEVLKLESCDFGIAYRLLLRKKSV